MVAVFSVAGLGACSDQPSADERAAQSEEEAAEAREQRLREQRERETAVYRECVSVTKALTSKLSDLDSRLTIGLQFDDYSRKVGDAQVAYDRLIKDLKRREGVSDRCINKVGLPLERALNQYVTAYNVWNDCIGDYSCSFEGAILKRAQRSWAKATTGLERAAANLDAMRPSAS